MSHSKLMRRAPFHWMKFIEFHWTSGAQMRSNERHVHSPPACACASVLVCTLHDNVESYVPHTHQLHHYDDDAAITPRVSWTSHHTYVRTHACYTHRVRCFFLFMNENLTVYEPCGWFLFALVLCLPFCFSSIFFFCAIPNIRSIVFFLLSFASVWNSSH